jgi:hypothetical protein
VVTCKPFRDLEAKLYDRYPVSRHTARSAGKSSTPEVMPSGDFEIS